MRHSSLSHAISLLFTIYPEVCVNPLLSRHLYSSARRNRFFVLLSLYLLGIALLTGGFSLMISLPGLVEEESLVSMLDLFMMGRSLYWFSSVILLLTAALIVPINALGAISGERENRTLALLVTTTLKPRAIVLGKVGAALLTGGIYVLAPLPLLMLGFWLGGVTVTELLLTMLMLVLTMILSIAWAIFISGRVRKTLTGVLNFYVINVVLLPLLIILAFFAITLVVALRYSDVDVTMLPFWLVLVIQHGWIVLVGFHPLSAAIATEALGLEYGSWGLLTLTVDWFGTSSTLPSVTLPSPWITFTISTVLTVAFLLWRTTRRLAKPERR